MGTIVMMRPGQPAVAEDFAGETVGLEDLHRLLGCDTVDVRSLGPNPASGRRSDMWFDDDGLLNDAPANRRLLPSDVIIAGTILVCATDEAGDSLPLTDAEAAAVLKHVERWEILPPDTEKPEPKIEVFSWPERSSR